MFATRRSAMPSLWSELNRLQEEMGRSFGPDRDTAVTGRLPINAWEKDDSLFVEAELPGLDLEKLEITVEGGNELTIRGERTGPGDDGQWLKRERQYGPFARTFQLPFEVDSEKVTADYESGVLRLELPKREEDKPRRIEVKVK